MALTTNGLVFYFNSQYGFTPNDSWKNLISNSFDLDVAGCSIVNNGVHIDGVDDITWKNSDKYPSMNLIDFTVEIRYKVYDWSSGYFLEMNADNYKGIVLRKYTDNTIKGVYDDEYNIYNISTNSYSPSLIDNTLNIVMRRAGGTVNIFVNGSLGSTTYVDSTNQLLFNNSMSFGGEHVENSSYSVIPENTSVGEIYAIRFYNRALTNTEIMNNYNIGNAIGMSIPQTQIGTYKTSSFTLPVYKLSDVQNNQLRTYVNGEIGSFDLVDLSNSKASSIRISTPNGIKSIKKL